MKENTSERWQFGCNLINLKLMGQRKNMHAYINDDMYVKEMKPTYHLLAVDTGSFVKQTCLYIF